MRHHNSNRKFHRETDQRRALLRSLARSLILHGSIKTTEAKAKEIRGIVEKLVTKGKTGTVAARRAILKDIGVDGAKHLIENVSPKYAERPGGYLRIVKMGVRKNGAVPMSLVSFV